MGEKEFTFVFTESEANLILQAIGQLPFVQAQPIVTKIQQQAQKQMEQPSAFAE